MANSLNFSGNITVQDVTCGDVNCDDVSCDSLTVKVGSTSKSLLNFVYPVGSIYISINSTNPSTLFGGTWTRFGKGKTLVGLDENDTAFDTSEETGGEKTHTLTVAEMPSHTHNFWAHDSVGSSSGFAGIATNSFDNRPQHYTGGGEAHNNLQPYITVYMWKRTA